MGSRRGWLAVLLLGVPLLLITADPVLLGDAHRPARVSLLVLVTVGAAWGAVRNRPSAPATGWLTTGVVAVNTLNALLGLDSIALILLGFASGLGAVVLILRGRRDGFRPAAGIDALVATAAPFAVVLVAAGSQPLPGDAPALLVANFVVLFLVALAVSLPHAVVPSLAFGLAAIALSTVVDVASLMHTPFTEVVASFLVDLPLLLLAVATLHPTFAAVTSAAPLSDQRHRVIRLLLLSASLATTLLLTVTDVRFLEGNGVVLAAVPLILAGLICYRMVQWIRLLDDTARTERARAQVDELTGLRSPAGCEAQRYMAVICWCCLSPAEPSREWEPIRVARCNAAVTSGVSLSSEGELWEGPSGRPQRGRRPTARTGAVATGA